MNNRIKLAVLILGMLCAGEVWSAMYYISPGGNDTSGNGSSGSPWRTLTKAYSMGGGHTYILKDGTYNYSGCEINDDTPNGTSTAYTIIKAENDGGAVVTQTNGIYLNANKAYIQIEGLKFVSSASEEKAIGSSTSHHLKVLRCAFVGGPSSGNTVNADTSGKYILFEDCWFYGGGGRYQLMVYMAQNVILRRCVVRQDGGYTYNGSDPEAGFSIYDSSGVILQNCIAIDHNLTYSAGETGAFYNTGHALSGHYAYNNHYYGCIALNIDGALSSFHFDPDAPTNGMSMTDCIAYNGGEGIGGENTGSNMTFNRVTIGNMTDRPVRMGQSGKTWTMSNSILWSGGNNSSSISVTYTDTYSPNDYSGTGVIHVNPTANGLLYLPRIETGGTLATAGFGNGQMGANVTKRYGVSGTLWGETGYNTLTSENLWPWPNEARIKADFASVANGARGFCTGTSRDGSSQTLTKYIWEYLGNTIPTELGGGGSAIPVDVPSSLAATPLSSRAIQLAWMDNSTNENGFKIERKNVNGVYSQIASVDANILSYNDVGLAPNATYYYRVRAFNAATDSAYSNEASAVTLTFAGDITIGKAPLVSAGEVRIVGSAKWRGVINPDAGETAKIYFKGSGNGKFEVKIFTLTGELVWEQTMENVSEGMFEWVPKDVASGGYIVYVTGPGLNTNKKIAILR